MVCGLSSLLLNPITTWRVSCSNRLTSSNSRRRNFALDGFGANFVTSKSLRALFLCIASNYKKSRHNVSTLLYFLHPWEGENVGAQSLCTFSLCALTSKTPSTRSSPPGQHHLSAARLRPVRVLCQNSGGSSHVVSAMSFSCSVWSNHVGHAGNQRMYVSRVLASPSLRCALHVT